MAAPLDTLDEFLDNQAGVAAAVEGNSSSTPTPAAEEWSSAAWQSSWDWSWWYWPNRNYDSWPSSQGGTYAVVREVPAAEPQNGVAATPAVEPTVHTSGASASGTLQSGPDPLAVNDPWQSTANGNNVTAAAAPSGPVTSGQAQPEPWSGSWSWNWNAGQNWHWNQRDWRQDGWQAGQWSGPQHKPDYSEPPAWPGWSHRRLWTQSIRRWDKQTDVPIYRRAEKVLRSLGWDLQLDMEHLSEDVLNSSLYLDAIIEVLNNKAGVREDDDRRRAYRMAISDSQRHKDETLAQFAVRRQRDFRNAAAYGVQIPEALRAMLMREGAALSDQNQQNLTALLQGREEDPDAVARALSRMDVRHDRITAYSEDIPEELNYLATDEHYEEEEDGEDLDESDMLQELDKLDLDENQICEVFAVLEQRRRSWKENKLLKADMRKDRGNFVKDGANAAPRGQYGGVPGGGIRRGGKGSKGSGRGGLNREQLKKVSKCHTCHKKGHWSEDCPQNASQNGQRKNPGPSGFAYIAAAMQPPVQRFLSGL